MKHAGTESLRQLAGLLDQVRRRPRVKEKNLGVFYRQSKAFLHFHEDPAGLFADLRIGDEFERFPVNTSAERSALLAAIDRTLSD